MQVKVIVGNVIQKSNKYLLVQEAKSSCHGKWNLPAGHLDPDETLTAAAIREAREETGCNIQPTAICQIGNYLRADEIFVGVIFTSNLIDERIDFDPTEILDIKWFTYEEILAMRDQLRNPILTINSIENTQHGITAPLGIINIYGESK